MKIRLDPCDIGQSRISIDLIHRLEIDPSGRLQNLNLHGAKHLQFCNRRNQWLGSTLPAALSTAGLTSLILLTEGIVIGRALLSESLDQSGEGTHDHDLPLDHSLADISIPKEIRCLCDPHIEVAVGHREDQGIRNLDELISHRLDRVSDFRSQPRTDPVADNGLPDSSPICSPNSSDQVPDDSGCGRG